MLIAVLQSATYCYWLVHAQAGGGEVFLLLIPGFIAQITVTLPYKGLGRNLYSILLPIAVLSLCFKPLETILLSMLLPLLCLIRLNVKEIKWLCVFADIVGAVLFIFVTRIIGCPYFGY